MFIRTVQHQNFKLFHPISPLQPDSFIFAQRHNRDLKLCDFGLTQRMEPGGVARVLLGNGEYLAPEIINYEPVSFAADMWSMGAVAYTM